MPLTLWHAYNYPIALVYLIIGCFAATVIVEYPVVYWLLGRPAKARIRLFLWIVFVNVITNPAVQIALLFVDPVVLRAEELAWLTLGLIELVVVIVEFGLLRWIFSRMHRASALDEPVTARSTFVIALVANLASFVIGGIVVKAVVAVAYGFHFLDSGW